MEERTTGPILRQLAQDRLEDARVLLEAERWFGTSYLCGYAVELALKWRICSLLGWDEFPPSRRGFESFKTHDLDTLLMLAGLRTEIARHRMRDWSLVRQWDPADRYRVVHVDAPTGPEQRTAIDHATKMFGATERLVTHLCSTS